MDAAKLRELGNQCHAAADQLEQGKGKTRGVGGFDWKSLVKYLLQGAVQLLDQSDSPASPKA